MNAKTMYLQTIKQVLFSLLMLLPLALAATHNRAGEIHLEQTGPLTLKATIITWTKTSSFNVDRDTLTICWGDGTCENVPRSNGNGLPLANDVKYNTYVAYHTFAGPATYEISMNDQNRVGGIINVNPPSSDLIPFHIFTSYTFQDSQFGGVNTTPYLLQPPIDNACVGKPYKHNPNAFDPDGDSLSYQLVVPFQLPGEPVPNYSFPNQISPGSNNLFQLDEVSGDLIWFTPQTPGLYNIAFAVISWRNKIPIDFTIRDMQIRVDQCDNNPPVVTAPDKFCVVAGSTVAFEVSADDIDSSDQVQLTALGGPLNTPYSPATFTVPTGWNDPVLKGQFSWTTDCEHISDQPYSVVFKAIDTIGPTVPQLIDLKTVTIKVVGPAPENVQAVAGTGAVELTWDKPYACEVTDNNYFYGFSVWRREGSLPFVIDTCDPGLSGKGYTEIVFVTKTMKDGRYYYKDTNVQRGRTYCYRVEGKFARISGGGFPYNIVESLPSTEVCVQLPRDLPIITKVSVGATASTTGTIEVCWTKPLAMDLDTIQNPGPYRYQVLRSSGLSGGTLVEIPGASFTAPTFWQANDTCFTDTGLNTAAGPFHYQVAFYVNGNNVPLGSTNTASSVFLGIQSTDNQNNLSWQASVPWGNYQYEVYRLNDVSAQFELIGTATQPAYEDKGLNNGQNYCYQVRTEGTYGVSGIVAPLFNWSQESCGTPIDTVPPCPPALTVTNRCTSGDVLVAPDPPYENLLTWTNPNLACPSTDDAAQYNIWYSAVAGEPLTLLESVSDPNSTSFTHEIANGLVGCYAVTAIDAVGNESARSNIVCVENCAEYTLPNAFTPNNDGQNDIFEPFPGWRFVERVDMQVFNRWGNLVFSTTDPAIQWSGVTNDGKKLADGTYFYLCKVFIPNLNGETSLSTTLNGWIELVGSN
jgi:gliding motility-associated-like protein